MLRTATPAEENPISRVEKTLDVNVPIRVAYDQWTQFEEFARFMDGVKSVQQLGDTLQSPPGRTASR